MIRAAALLVALWLAVPGLAHAAPPSYGKRSDVREFIREMVERHGFVERELEYLFSRARRQEPILQAIQPPTDGRLRAWEDYRAQFVNERRIAAGLEFWRAHRGTLERAARIYGVPEEIIVAIIGVETFYGRNTGRWRVVDALTTLAFDYPPRADFFRGELEAYLLFARETGFDVFSVHGSYAGAIGIPQFIPSSYRRYAVDFDGDGVTDLRGSAADAIGSVANFLVKHGWRAGEAVLMQAAVSGDAHRPYADGGVEPRHPLNELTRAGIQLRAAAPPAHGTPVVLIELVSPGRPSDYRVGLRNFYVLTRYNRSSFYATAVADLAEALRAEMR